MSFNEGGEGVSFKGRNENIFLRGQRSGGVCLFGQGQT